MIRAVELSDASRICEIYNHYIEKTCITFEEDIITSSEMEQRIRKITKTLPWIVFYKEDIVQGYAYASPWRVRSAYRFSVESTVYIHKDFQGRGAGRKLYEVLLEELSKRETHLVIGGITMPNEPSVKLHESLGFKKCAMFKEVGYKMNQWRDVGYWEKKLN